MSQGLSGENTGNYTAVYFHIQGHTMDIHDQLVYVKQVMVEHPEYQLVGTYCDVCPENGNAPLSALMSLREDARSGLFQILLAPSIMALDSDALQELTQYGVTVYIDNAKRHPVNPWIEALRELMYAQ